MYWLQNIGPALLTSLWQSAVAYILLYVFRRSKFTTPNQTYLLGIGLQYVLAAFFLYAIFCGDSFQNSGDIQSGILSKNIVSNNYISYTYIILLLLNNFLFLYHSIRSQRANQRLERNTIVPPVTLNALTEKWKQQLGIKRPIHLLLQESVLTPFTKGILKPTIVLPLSFINGLGTQQMEAVLLHEFWHIKRFDYLFLLIQLYLEKVMYFNPFFLLISKAIHEDRELSCDIHAIQSNSLNTASYIESLLFFTGKENQLPHTQTTLAITGKHNGELVNRAAYLLEGRKNKTYQASLGMNLIAATAFLLSAISTTPQLNANITAMAQQPSTFSEIASIEKAAPIVRIPSTEQQHNISENNTNKNSELIEKKVITKNNIKKKIEHEKPIFSKPTPPNIAEGAASANQEDNSFVRMASNLQTSNNIAGVHFKPLTVNANKAIFVATVQDPNILEQVFQQAVNNINKHFDIESSSFQYTSFSDNNQNFETSTTELKSDTYQFVLIKGKQKMVLAIKTIDN